MGGIEPPRVNLYALLGVDPEADTATINAAYRRTAKLYHPDVTGSSESTLYMSGLNIAREWLTVPDRRAAYDLARRRLWVGRQSFAGADGASRKSEYVVRRRTWAEQTDMLEWAGLGRMPRTSHAIPEDPFPGAGCPVCRGRPPHCALGHVGAYRPRFRDRSYESPLDVVPEEHMWGHEYQSASARRAHAQRCPWAAGGGQKPDYFATPNWDLPPHYEARGRQMDIDPELISLLSSVVPAKVARAAFASATAGCIVIAVEEGNWLASVFAGRWAYDVRVERDQAGLLIASSCNCLRESPCVHAIATWIVWAAGAVRPRPPASWLDRTPVPPGR